MRLFEGHDFPPRAYALAGSHSMAGYGYSNDGLLHYPYHEDRGSTYYDIRRRDYYGDRWRETYYNAPVTFHDPHNTYRRDYGAPDSNFRDYAPVTFYVDPYNNHRAAPVTTHDPYDNYRRDYGARRSSNDRYGVVPQEEVYRRDEYRPHRHDGYHDKKGHDVIRRERRTVELWVPMCCDKCERRVKEHLEDMEGAEKVTTDQWTKKVVVVGNVHPDYVLARARRHKNGSEFWESRRKPQ